MKIIKLKFYSYLIYYNLRQKLHREQSWGWQMVCKFGFKFQTKTYQLLPHLLSSSLFLSLFLFPALCAIKFYRPQVKIPINLHASVARGIY